MLVKGLTRLHPATVSQCVNVSSSRSWDAPQNWTVNRVPRILRCVSGALGNIDRIRQKQFIVVSITYHLLGESSLVLLEGDGIAPVSSNDLLYDEHGVSTGEIAVNVPGAFGKHQRFLDIAATARRAANDLEPPFCGTRRCITMYVGDSVTDILGMLDADVGIVVGNSGTFERVASAFGISVRPLSSAYDSLDAKLDAVTRESRSVGRCVYRVAHWEEIEVFLFGDG